MAHAVLSILCTKQVATSPVETLDFGSLSLAAAMALATVRIGLHRSDTEKLLRPVTRKDAAQREGTPKSAKGARKSRERTRPNHPRDTKSAHTIVHVKIGTRTR